MTDKRKIAQETQGVEADEDRITHEQKKISNNAELTHRERKYLERVHGHGEKMHEMKLDRERQARRNSLKGRKVIRRATH